MDLEFQISILSFDNTVCKTCFNFLTKYFMNISSKLSYSWQKLKLPLLHSHLDQEKSAQPCEKSTWLLITSFCVLDNIKQFFLYFLRAELWLMVFESNDEPITYINS